MLGIWNKKTPMLPAGNGPRFAVVQDDRVVGSFPREQKPNAVGVAAVIARATGRDTQVYEIAEQTVDAEIVGKVVNPLAQGWSWVFSAPQRVLNPRPAL